jgi:2-keto-4-pentenoate hydratase/2-oxohepta-3-ene-1,7-dioic acid hydratase in catechol pathway
LKLVTYLHGEACRLGVVSDGRPGIGSDGHLVNLGQAWAAYQESTADSVRLECPADMGALLQSGEETWRRLASVVAWAQALPATAADTLWRPLDGVRLAAPLANPSKIVCVGLNYHDHCREQGLDVPQRPILFAKFPSTIIGHEAEITWPGDLSQQVDYEAELAVVIGRRGRHIPVDEAYRYVAGYTNLNDVSARDVQFADEQWVRGKSFDTFCPLGPYLVTADEVPDPHDLRIRCWVNGELRQDSNTRELVFNVPQLVAYISRTCTLMPGDIISTGTPGGVGVFREPPVFLQPGDVVEVEIDRLGRLRNRVR